MSRKLAVVFLAMFVLVGAMGLKTLVAAHTDGVMVANGAGPAPPNPPSR